MGKLWRGFVILTAIFLWVAYAKYLFHLFENARFFSHLSDTEREMTYRTEMGLYFSYYKTLISSDTFLNGLSHLLRDNVTEYGHTINTLQRFNLYPEVIIALAYRAYKTLADHFNWKDQECWRVNRGSNEPPVESCEGIGNYHYFYIYAVFFVAGSVLPSLFLCGTLLSGGYIGGLLTALAFIFNHGEAARVQWTPPLRESFAYPFFVAQLLVLTKILKQQKSTSITSIAFIFSTVAFCTFWQLSHFILVTQLASILIVYSFGAFSTFLLSLLCKLYSLSFLLSLILLFGNSMLLNSLFFTSLLSILAIIRLQPIFLRISSFRPFLIFANLLLFCIGTIGFKLLFFLLIFHNTADNHIWDLLIAKFFNIHTFHTRLYTCAAEFDFLNFETIQKLILSWLLPTASFSVLLLLIVLFKSLIPQWNNNSRNGQPNKLGEYAEFLFHFIQLGFFVLMALLVMRLKLFATPQLCLFCSLSLNKDLLQEIFGERLISMRYILAVLLIAGMANQGWENVKEQFDIQGEYNNPEQEKLFLWINESTQKDAIFAGTMALMANVKLTTLRPIFNHPHYESEEIRNRTLTVYSIYGRKSLEVVYRSFRSVGIQYYVFQPQQCIENNPKVECSYLAMWDEHVPAEKGNPSLCHRIWEGVKRRRGEGPSIAQFRPVYQSPNYIVLAL